MSYGDHPPQDPYRRDDGRGDVPYRPGSENNGTSPGSRSRQPVPPWTTSQGQPQLSDTSSPYGTPNWASPPSAPYNIPSSHRQQQVQPYLGTQSQLNPSGQEPTYYRPPGYGQPGYLPPGTSSDRGSGPGYDRAYLPQPQPQPTQYDIGFATQTQHRSPPFQGRQEYQTPQQHAQQAYPPPHSQQQQYSAHNPQQPAYHPPHSQEQQYSAQYLQQQNRTYYPGRVAAMESQGGANYAAAGGSYPSGNYADNNYPSLPPPGSQPAEGLGSPIVGGGGGSSMGGGANVAVRIHRRRYGDDATGRGYDDGDEVEE
ncbi:hypothetical protein BC827DRAFT_186621 [Russula dissimulans]|nr:hypothetical protein BC827DRAFT_186621 [Russula dissimulans]